MRKRAKKIYLVWEGDYEDGANYWSIFNSIDEATHNYKNDDKSAVEIFEAEPKPIGYFVGEQTARKAKGKP